MADRAALVRKANKAYWSCDGLPTPEERMSAAIDLIRNEALEEAIRVTNHYHSYRFNTSKQIADSLEELKGSS
jgi:hypothetical protein